jgi:hypothetical protein
MNKILVVVLMTASALAGSFLQKIEDDKEKLAERILTWNTILDNSLKFTCVAK